MRQLQLLSRLAVAAAALAASTCARALAMQLLDKQLAASPSKCFPDKFMFGSATASYQVEGAVKEGGRTPSIWDDYCRSQPGVMCANVADDFYHRYKSDIQLMVETGLQSFRFSISWSRVMNWDPATRRMKANPEGIAFYHSLIDELHSNSIEPILTLYHWDLPSELQTQLSPPGWLNAEIQDHFVEYSTLLFNEYGHKIDYWTTFNEPQSFVGYVYGMGVGAPGVEPSPTDTYTVGHNVLVSHARAVQTFRTLKAANVVGEKARIGIALVANYYYPLDAANPKDIAAAERGLQFEMGWFLMPIVMGDYPSVMRERTGDRLPTFTDEESHLLKGSYDLFMLNHYGSRAATDCDSPTSNTPCSSLPVGVFRDAGVDPSHLVPGSIQGKVGSHGNNYCQQFTGYPPGYLAMMKWMHAKDPTADILLTENGWCGNDEIEDTEQLTYFKAFIEQVYFAVVQEKISVIGYTAWSFFDNYEWGSYGPRFGLFYVNFTSQTGSPDYYEPKPTDLARIARPSAKWFKKVAATRCLDGWSDLETSEGSGTSTSSLTLVAGVIVGVFALVGVAAASIAVAAQRRRHAGYESIPLQ